MQTDLNEHRSFSHRPIDPLRREEGMTRSARENEKGWSGLLQSRNLYTARTARHSAPSLAHEQLQTEPRWSGLLQCGGNHYHTARTARLAVPN